MSSGMFRPDMFRSDMFRTGAGDVTVSPAPAISFASAIAPLVILGSILTIPAPAISTAVAVPPTISTGISFDVANRGTLTKQILYRVGIDGYPDVFTNYSADGVPYIREIEPFRKKVNDLEGNTTLGDLVIVLVDKSRAILGAFPTFLFEGKAVTLKVGLPGLAETDFEILFHGFIDRVDGDEHNLEWRIVCKDRSILLRKTIYELGDDGQKISGDHPHTLAGHPIDLLLAILEIECALPASYIDYSTILNYRNLLLAGMRFSFSLDSAVEAKQFIEQELLRPLGGWLHVTRKGLMTIRFFFPIPGQTDPVHSLTANNVIGIPVPEQAELLNVLQHRYDADTDTPHSTVSKDTESIALYGFESLQPIDSQGMRANLGAASISRTVGSMLFKRYGSKPLVLTTLCFFDAVLVDTGDFVSVSNPHVPDRTAGALGIIDRKMEVLGVTRYFREGRVELELLDAVGLCAQYYIAPTGETTYVLTSPENQERYMYVSDDATEQYSNGDPGHELG